MSPGKKDRPRFHLAFPVNDLDKSRRFYVDVLGCGVGRESSHWVDFNFFGHQVVAHLCAEDEVVRKSDVDGDAVPVRHFGVILEWAEWHRLRERLEAASLDFVIPPRIRFAGQAGEQATMFISDPSGNALEFKSFKDETQVFARDSKAMT
ncbi:MAG: VOC family protein [Gammaproteobacteria bacterium]